MIIRNAAPLGFKPWEIRDMIPRDWLLVVRGYNDQAKIGKPGADAPSAAEVAELVERYG